MRIILKVYRNLIKKNGGKRQEKSIVNKHWITSFLPLMKMHFIFEGFSIKTEHLQFFSEMLLGCIQSVEFTMINLSVWNVSTDLLHSLLAKKVSGEIFHSVLPKMRATLTWWEGRHYSWQPWLAKDVGATCLYWGKLKSKKVRPLLCPSAQGSKYGFAQDLTESLLTVRSG